jgi:predicted DCC family thiol-disulfide oxidoreductase YuxK
MKNLESKTILYDDVCPLCQAYTGCFVRFGWLGRRRGLAGLSAEVLARIDLERARHEIPLYDEQTGETVYGLDALFLILGTQFPVLKPVFASRLVRYPLRQLYNLISYNRRVIAGTRPPASGFDCGPDVSIAYRLAYIGLALVLTVLLGGFAVLPELAPFAAGPDHVIYRALIDLSFLALVPVGLLRRDKLTFFGHWATLALIVAIFGAVLPAGWGTEAFRLALFGWLWGRRWPLV